MKIQPDLSVCTCITSSSDSPEKLLTSLYETADPVAIEVVLVDMSGGSGRAALKNFPEIILYENPHPESPTKALNRAMQIATGRYLSIWDYDVIATPDSLYNMLTFLDENPDIGLAAPKILNAYGIPEPTCRRFHTLLSLFATFAPPLFAPLTGGIRKNHLMADFKLDATTEIDWLCSGVHFLRQEVFDELGFLDDRLSLYFSELDYYFRARKSGWHNYYFHDAEVIHTSPARYHQEISTEKNIKAICADSLTFLQKKWFATKKLSIPSP